MIWEGWSIFCPIQIFSDLELDELTGISLHNKEFKNYTKEREKIEMQSGKDWGLLSSSNNFFALEDTLDSQNKMIIVLLWEEGVPC